MSTYTDKLGNKLNALLEKNYDAEKGFKKAAEKTHHEALKSYFNKKAQEHNKFSHELKTEIKTFGKEPEKGGSVSGAAHRAWMDIKTVFSTDKEEAMLEEAIRGEKASVKEYAEVLGEASLPETTKKLLLSQKKTIEQGLYNIKRLEDLS